MLLKLNKHFLFVERDGREELVPIERDPSLGLTPGKPVIAADWLAKLRAIAKEKQRNLEFP